MKSKLVICILLAFAGIVLPKVSAEETTVNAASDMDLSGVMARGEIRHLGVPYAEFVTGTGGGLDVEVIKLFAVHLGVRYKFVGTNWGNIIKDLTGKEVSPDGDDILVGEKTEVKGDIIGTGFTILPWRQKVVNFSSVSFPTQVWLTARAESPLMPIKPSGDIHQDIKSVKGVLKGIRLLGKKNTCLDPDLYQMDKTGAMVSLFQGSVNELAPALINGEADAVLLDVPDSLVALSKWPGMIKVIGPISEEQGMGYAFRKNSPHLLVAFEAFFNKLKADGRYGKLVEKYYPNITAYYPEFIKAPGKN